jgi:hypothetical protein
LTPIIPAILLIAGVFAYILIVRAKDLPPAELASPVKHLEERKATIYDNLRDLNFEYRLGKLSDADYQATKLGLQKELAAVLAEIERVGGAEAARQPAPAPPDPLVCPACGARFDKPLKFCGECGKPMPGVVA